ncbi:hypothetical protein B0H11DRAFT_1901174 [Mycena galericulata]|nr:hypothetical protein B0H11DRAFT_1901174 [Mycena galericulata]
MPPRRVPDRYHNSTSHIPAPELSMDLEKSFQLQRISLQNQGQVIHAHYGTASESHASRAQRAFPCPCTELTPLSPWLMFAETWTAGSLSNGAESGRERHFRCEICVAGSGIRLRGTHRARDLKRGGEWRATSPGGRVTCRLQHELCGLERAMHVAHQFRAPGRLAAVWPVYVLPHTLRSHPHTPRPRRIRVGGACAASVRVPLETRESGAGRASERPGDVGAPCVGVARRSLVKGNTAARGAEFDRHTRGEFTCRDLSVRMKVFGQYNGSTAVVMWRNNVQENAGRVGGLWC